MRTAKNRRLPKARLSLESLESRQMLAFDLVSDFSAEPNSSFPSNFLYAETNAELGSGYYMSALRPDIGVEVVYNRPTTGARNYIDINPGPESSSPAEFTQMGTKIFVVATSAEKGRELWLVQGNATGGTFSLVRDIRIGSASSNPENLFVMGDWLFFTAEGSAGNRELWRTDGSFINTVLVKEINPSLVLGSNPADFVIFGTELYFTASTFASGRELWRTGGTEASTKMIKDIYAGANSSFPKELTVAGNKLFFSANHPSHGREVWVSDGTEAGTKLLKDIATNSRGGGPSSNPEELTAVNDNLYFRATTSSQGTELYRYDPNVFKDVFMVKNIAPGANSSDPIELTAAEGFLYFVASDVNLGRVLHRSGGTAATTVPLKQLNVNNNSTNNAELFYNEGFLYSRGYNPFVGYELWVTRISDNKTKVYDLKPGLENSAPAEFTRQKNGVIFSATDNEIGSEVFSAFGHGFAGKWLDIWPGNEDSNLLDMDSFGGNAYLSVQSGNNGGEAKVWRHNPATDTLTQVSANNEYAYTVEATSSGLYYFTYTDSNMVDWKLWRTTGAEPTLVQSFNGDGQSLEFNSTFVVGDQLYFVFNRTVNGVTTPQLRRASGTGSGAPTIALPANSRGVYGGIAVGDTLYLNVQIGPTELRLVKINGTSASVMSDVFLQNNNKLARIGNKVLFMGTVADGASGLYSSDGTTAGTQLLQAGLYMSSEKQAALGGFLYFGASVTTDYEVWRTDGTAAGTGLFKVVNRLGGSNPDQFTTVGNAVYFSATNATHGVELWKIDGASLVTTQMKNIAPGSASSDPVSLVNAAGTLYFFATTSANGKQLYKSDGTQAGTSLVPGAATVYDSVNGTTQLDRSKSMIAIGSTVYFSAKSDNKGNEVPYYSPTAARASASRASAANAVATDLALGALDFAEWDNQRRTRAIKA